MITSFIGIFFNLIIETKLAEEENDDNDERFYFLWEKNTDFPYDRNMLIKYHIK